MHSANPDPIPTKQFPDSPESLAKLALELENCRKEIQRLNRGRLSDQSERADLAERLQELNATLKAANLRGETLRSENQQMRLKIKLIENQLESTVKERDALLIANKAMYDRLNGTSSGSKGATPGGQSPSRSSTEIITPPRPAHDRVIIPRELAGVLRDLLATARRQLPYFARHTNNPEVVEDFCQKIDAIAQDSAKSGISNLQLLARALATFVRDLQKNQDLMTSANLRALWQSIDFLALVWEEVNLAKAAALGRPDILAVDDEELVLEVLTGQMQSLGVNFHGVQNTREVLPLLSRHRFNLVLLDIRMDELNGLELCPQIRMVPGYNRTPIVFLTGMKTPEIQAQSSLVGGSDFIGKPFYPSEIRLKTLFWALWDQMGMEKPAQQ